jgi:hypothetical protein
MPISTTNNSSNANSNLDKRDKILQMQAKHNELFIKERKVSPRFLPRIPYIYKGQVVIGLYTREIYGGKDVYIELCTKDFMPLDSNRTLLKWIFNENYKTDYPLSDPHPSTQDRMSLIPLSELLNVNRAYDENHPKLSELTNLIDITPKPIVEPKTEPEPSVQFEFDATESAGLDVPYADMTLRDYAAIKWHKPVSGKKWLNELITNTFK